ncbi:MAG: GTPase ObgE [Bacilli bacterium]|nr:GTPase ObgE [Bacilli bacterium]
MFVDSVKIHVKAGDGGDGIVAFLHEKYMDKGGPSGGHGGRGGSVIFVGEEGLTTLLDFRFKRKITANPGQKGMDKNCAGRKGENVYVAVPVGTTIINAETNQVIGDITKHKQEVVVAKGGRGGKGNAAFASPKNTTPQFAEKGIKGEEFDVQLELKVLADVGLVGFPSVGKSTLISVVSKAKPKIAAYHFTTLVPNLGVVGVGDGRSFIMADLPGLIEGAAEGAGLGIQFLKHVERTKVIVHIIDMSATDGRDPVEDYKIIRKELGDFKEDLLKRAEILVANKMDVEGAEENLKRFKALTGIENIIPISAYTKDNLNELLYKIADTLDEVRSKVDYTVITDTVVEYNFVPEKNKYEITMDDSGFFHVDGPAIEKLFERTDFNNEVSVRQFARALRDLGVDAELRELGAEEGETIIILGYEFEFVA